MYVEVFGYHDDDPIGWADIDERKILTIGKVDYYKTKRENWLRFVLTRTVDGFTRRRWDHVTLAQVVIAMKRNNMIVPTDMAHVEIALEL